jgi:choline dehydrogenase-like flavoprotein
VRARRRGLDPILTWSLHPADLPILTKALRTLSDLFFAAGARSVVPGIYGVPEELHSRSEAEILRTHPLAVSDIVLGGNHAFCTTRMHGDPRRGVVDELGWIADTGVFPRCPSVNPMWTAMALAHRTAQTLADRL